MSYHQSADYRGKHRRGFFGWLWLMVRSYLVLVGAMTTLLSLVLFFALMRLGANLGQMGDAGGASAQLQQGTADPYKGEEVVLHSALDAELAEGELAEAQTRWLELEIDGALVLGLGQQAGGLQSIVEAETRLSLMEVRRTLEKAAEDERVQGLFINIRRLQGSGVLLGELHRVLEVWKRGGKALHVFVQSLDDANMVIASLADKVWMSAEGSVMLVGSQVTLTYFSDTLRKLGIGIDVVRAGSFKSAVEPFVRNSPSRDASQMYQGLIASLNEERLALIERAGKWPRKDVETWFKEGLYTAQEALDLGMVDGLSYERALKRSLRVEESTALLDWGRYTGRSAQPVGFDQMMLQWAAMNEADSRQVSGELEDGFAYIEARGGIVMHDPDGGSDESITPKTLNQALVWARDAEHVKSVVLRIDSGGGSALASDIILETLRSVEAVKPVIVSFGSVAASGGYYIAAEATRIFAEPQTVTGSIGVFGLIPNFQGARSKFGFSFHTFSESDRQNLFDPGSQLSTADKRLLEKQVDQVYATFVERVAEGRSLEREAVLKLAGGRVYSGRQALQLGLVDEMGGLWEAIFAAKSLGGLDPEQKYPVYMPPTEDKDLQMLLRSLSQWIRPFGLLGGGQTAAELAKLAGYSPESIQFRELRVLLSSRRERPGDVALAYWPGRLDGSGL